jgi:hypothetical protein
MHRAFPGSEYYGGSAPTHGQQQTAYLPVTGLAGRCEGSRGRVPTFTADRSTGSVPNFAPAASPRVRRSPSPWPPGRPVQADPRVTRHHPGGCAPPTSPDPPGLELAAPLRDVKPLVPHVHLPVSLSRPGPSGSPGPPCRCRGCFPPVPGASRSGLPPASTGLLRQPGGGVLSPPLDPTAPRGARTFQVQVCGPRLEGGWRVRGRVSLGWECWMAAGCWWPGTVGCQWKVAWTVDRGLDGLPVRRERCPVGDGAMVVKLRYFCSHRVAHTIGAGLASCGAAS